MDRRRMKRKHFELVKNDLAVELTKLTSESMNINNDLHSATEDFEAMCKSMNDRQTDFLTRGLFLEEQYGKVMDVLDGKSQHHEVESSGENEILPTAYAENIKKFAADSSDSLRNHRILREVQLQEMDKVFKKYEVIWKQNMKELGERAEQIEKERAKLSTKLFEFSRSVVEESDSD